MTSVYWCTVVGLDRVECRPSTTWWGTEEDSWSGYQGPTSGFRTDLRGEMNEVDEVLWIVDWRDSNKN